MRWAVKRNRWVNPWKWHRWFAWRPVLVDYPDETSEWVWWEYVTLRLIVREGGAWTWEARREET